MTDDNTTDDVEPDDEDTGEDDRRLLGRERPRTRGFVASALGVTRLELSGDQVGRFSLVWRGETTAIAGAGETVVVGTDEDVLVGSGEEFAETGFGPAKTVTVADGTPVAAAPDGRVARLDDGEWVEVGTVQSPRRADGAYLVASNGVYRVDDGLVALGGEAVRDVAAAGPYAATADGLVRYDGEWVQEFAGDCTLVAAEGSRVHAASDAGLRARRDGEWVIEDLPVDAPLAGLAYGQGCYAVTVDGTLLVYAEPEDTPDGQGGWRPHTLGVRKVVGMTVP
jgi:hypothetical protein